MSYVVCPEKITSPAGDPARGIPPNVPCDLKVRIIKPAPFMECRCPRGHHFYATSKDLKEDQR